jgi:hypothetical protein
VLIVLAATRERSTPVQLPRPLRLGKDQRDQMVDPESRDPEG